jgi:hypothetical protein
MGSDRDAGADEAGGKVVEVEKVRITESGQQALHAVERRATA